LLAKFSARSFALLSLCLQNFKGQKKDITQLIDHQTSTARRFTCDLDYQSIASANFASEGSEVYNTKSLNVIPAPHLLKLALRTGTLFNCHYRTLATLCLQNSLLLFAICLQIFRKEKGSLMRTFVIN
jgi:hypothetical protein